MSKSKILQSPQISGISDNRTLVTHPEKRKRSVQSDPFINTLNILNSGGIIKKTFISKEIMNKIQAEANLAKSQYPIKVKTR